MRSPFRAPTWSSVQPLSSLSLRPLKERLLDSCRRSDRTCSCGIPLLRCTRINNPTLKREHKLLPKRYQNRKGRRNPKSRNKGKIGKRIRDFYILVWFSLSQSLFFFPGGVWKKAITEKQGNDYPCRMERRD